MKRHVLDPDTFLVDFAEAVFSETTTEHVDYGDTCHDACSRVPTFPVSRSPDLMHFDWSEFVGDSRASIKTVVSVTINGESLEYWLDMDRSDSETLVYSLENK
jgi:hypothetical protein